MKLKLSFAARTVIPFALALSGCGADQSDLSDRDSPSLSVLTPNLPGQAQVVCSRKVAFSGRSSAASGSRVTVISTDGRLTARTCTATVGTDQTWSCTQ